MPDTARVLTGLLPIRATEGWSDTLRSCGGRHEKSKCPLPQGEDTTDPPGPQKLVVIGWGQQ